MKCKMKKTGAIIFTMAIVCATSMSAMATEKIQATPAKETVPAMVVKGFDKDEKTTPMIKILDKDGKEITDLIAIQFDKINENTHEYNLEDGSIVNMTKLSTIENVSFEHDNVNTNTEKSEE